MTKANKTQKTNDPVEGFLKTVKPEQKQADCFEILALMKDVSGLTPKMWGKAIVGLGDYHYKYASGREGDSFRIGLSPRAQAISVYIMPGYTDFSEELARLGKHKVGKSCLYIKKISDVDIGVLREIVTKGLAIMEEKYPS